MNRETKFRGISTKTNQFVYGDLVINGPSGTYRIFVEFANVKHGDFTESGLHECSGELHIVNPESVCEFTGLKDKNGKEIYEGDIIQWKHSEQQKEEEFYIEKRDVRFRNGGFGFEDWYTDNNGNLSKKLIHHPGHLTIPDLYYVLFDIEIIGNIFQTPELLD